MSTCRPGNRSTCFNLSTCQPVYLSTCRLVNMFIWQHVLFTYTILDIMLCQDSKIKRQKVVVKANNLPKNCRIRIWQWGFFLKQEKNLKRRAKTWAQVLLLLLQTNLNKTLPSFLCYHWHHKTGHNFFERYKKIIFNKTSCRSGQRPLEQRSLTWDPMSQQSRACNSKVINAKWPISVCRMFHTCPIYMQVS